MTRSYPPEISRRSMPSASCQRTTSSESSSEKPPSWKSAELIFTASVKAAPVRERREELGEPVAVRGVDLHSVEIGAPAGVGREGETLHRRLDLERRHGPRAGEARHHLHRRSLRRCEGLAADESVGLSPGVAQLDQGGASLPRSRAPGGERIVPYSLASPRSRTCRTSAHPPRLINEPSAVR